MRRVFDALGMTVHLAMMVVALGAVAFLAGGCAATGTIAFGEDARAAVYYPKACPPTAPVGPVSLGERTTVTREYDDKIGLKPQLESETTVTEPMLAPPPEQDPPAQMTRGGDIGKTTGGIFKSLGALVWGAVKWVVGVPGL